MKKPIVGITTYGRDDEGRFTLPGEYVDSVRRAGGLPLLLAPGEGSVDEWLGVVDGVVFSGGGDLDPGLYDGGGHETIYNVDVERDRSELELARSVLDRGVPTLAICRGIQVFNVLLGGTLYLHLPEVVGDEVAHRAPPRRPTPHRHRLVDGTALHGLFGLEELEAQSWHHQAIRDVGRGLRVAAHAPDGVIEAVEMPDHPWFFAVQWHPELTSAEDASQQRLFDELVRVF